MLKNVVFINYNTVFFKESMTVLQLCSSIGIHLPRFCYHSALPIAANCRMCLIQLEESSKPIAACAVSTTGGMRILTDSTLVKQARENVLEFLLINHPLDCPICDQGGECDLQDQTMIFGSDRGKYYEKKRAVKDNIYLGVVVKTFMTRCIHCTRCVRFTQDVLGTNELGVIGRGNDMRITTFTKQILSSHLSGNIADICPVGALTSKPYAFTARPWELVSYSMIDFFDAVGGNLRIDTRGVEIMRVLPYPNFLINQEWATDKARLAYDGFARQRLKRPLIYRAVTRPLKAMFRPNTAQLVFIFKKKLLELILLMFINKTLCGLNFPHKMYISSILDFEGVMGISLLKQVFAHNAHIHIYDIFHNPFSFSKYYISRDKFISGYHFLYDQLRRLSKVNFVGFDPNNEAPLLYLRILKINPIKTPTLSYFSTKLSHNLQKTNEFTVSLSVKGFFKLFHYQSNAYNLLGQALLARLDYFFIAQVLDKNKSDYNLFPATASSPALYDLF